MILARSRSSKAAVGRGSCAARQRSEVWKQFTWLGRYGAPTPKPLYLFSNSREIGYFAGALTKADKAAMGEHKHKAR